MEMNNPVGKKIPEGPRGRPSTPGLLETIVEKDTDERILRL